MGGEVTGRERQRKEERERQTISKSDEIEGEAQGDT